MDVDLLSPVLAAPADERTLFGVPVEVVTGLLAFATALISARSKSAPTTTFIVHGPVHHADPGSVAVASQARRTPLGWMTLLVAVLLAAATVLLLLGRLTAAPARSALAPVTNPVPTTVPPTTVPPTTVPPTTVPPTTVPPTTVPPTTVPPEPLQAEVERFVQSWQRASRERRSVETIETYFAFPADWYSAEQVRDARALLSELPRRSSSGRCRLEPPDVVSVRDDGRCLTARAFMAWTVPERGLTGSSPVIYQLQRAERGQPFRIRSISEPPETPPACR